MKALLFLVLLWGGLATACAAGFSETFAVVLIDNATEAQLGEFPLPRSRIAAAVERAADLKAKAVVLKFFPKKFVLTNLNADVSLSGRSGWIPLPSLATNAHDIGFVDLDGDVATAVPMLERYQDQVVKTLVLCCLEAATGGKAVIDPGKMLTLANGTTLPLDPQNRVPAKLPTKDELNYIPFHNFIAGKTPAKDLAGKVVIIGYDGEKIPVVQTPVGPVRAHRLFVRQLRTVWDRIEPAR
jgi:CHASE2 domain-containing sensor protein